MPSNQIWQKSSFSGGGDGAECLEVTCHNSKTIAIRESDTPADVIGTTFAAMDRFIGHVKKL